MSPLLLSLVGDPGSGKTTFVCCPHERLGKVRYLAVESPAVHLTGINKEWVQDRIVIDPVARNGEGIRDKDENYHVAVMKAACTTYKEDTIIVDTMSGLAKNRHTDIMRQQKGIATKFRKENEPPQQLSIQFLEELAAANPGKGIIGLYHKKKIYKEGPEREFKTWWPALIGSVLDNQWAGAFDMNLAIRIVGEKYELLTKRTREWQFVFTRTPFGVAVPLSFDLTGKTLAEAETKMKEAWGKIFEIHDKS